jgi:hypothetical protein
MVLGAVLLATTGCYTYQPVRPGDAVLETRVRATVSARQAAELAPVMRNVTPTISGRLVDRSGEGVTLDVALHGGTMGMSASPLHSRIVIPAGELVTLESRTLSAWRTSLVGGIIVAAVSASWVAISGESTVDEKPKTGTDNAIRIRIPIGFR